MSARVIAAGEAGIWLGDRTPHPIPSAVAFRQPPKVLGDHCASSVARSPPSQNKKRLSAPTFLEGTQSLADRKANSGGEEWI